MYELRYYTQVGYRAAGMYKNRLDMVNHVRRLLKAEPNLLMVEAVEYIRRIVTGKTIIYHMTQEYLNYVEFVSKDASAYRAAYHQYMAAAYKCLRTGKAVSFKYY